MHDRPPTSACGGTAVAPSGRRAGRGVAAGLGIIAGACGVTCLAPALGVLVWPLVAVATGLGAYRLVAARGCGPTAAGTPDSAALVLPPEARRRRRAVGLAMLAVAAGLVAVALSGWLVVWPLAAVAAWFGASFLVASVTGYAGCPELGAIASLVHGRPVATACPPLDRVDARARRRC